jgi:hypothetical protein
MASRTPSWRNSSSTGQARFQARHQDVFGQLQAQVAGCRPLSIRPGHPGHEAGCAMSCAEMLTLMLSSAA